MELIRRAPWREAVTYRDTWPHKYVMAKKDRQEELLTYAAGLEAQIAVWVAPEILYEHAAALHWLNTWTSGPRFYGVKVMVLKNGNTLEPRFYPVVTPDEWNKKITLPAKAVDPHKLQFDAFFRPSRHGAVEG